LLYLLDREKKNHTLGICSITLVSKHHFRSIKMYKIYGCILKVIIYLTLIKIDGVISKIIVYLISFAFHCFIRPSWHWHVAIYALSIQLQRKKEKKRRKKLLDQWYCAKCDSPKNTFNFILYYTSFEILIIS